MGVSALESVNILRSIGFTNGDLKVILVRVVERTARAFREFNQFTNTCPRDISEGASLGCLRLYE